MTQNIKKHDVEAQYIELILVCCLFLGYTSFQCFASGVPAHVLRNDSTPCVFAVEKNASGEFWGPNPYVEESGSKPGLVQEFPFKHGKWYPCTSFNPDFLKSYFGSRISVRMGCLVATKYQQDIPVWVCFFFECRSSAPEVVLGMTGTSSRDPVIGGFLILLKSILLNYIILGLSYNQYKDP